MIISFVRFKDRITSFVRNLSLLKFITIIKLFTFQDASFHFVLSPFP